MLKKCALTNSGLTSTKTIIGTVYGMYARSASYMLNDNDNHVYELASSKCLLTAGGTSERGPRTYVRESG